ncbi:MAG: sporulation protein YqfD [Clostridia bacterium]|nr:sporulation protein YqfD [Clostridia bacterium]
MGKYPERLVNRCIEEGMILFDCERREGAVRACVSADDFKKLRRIIRGSECRVRLVSKKGRIRAAGALKRNAAFVTALSVAALAMILASTRIWAVRVDTVTVPEEEITEALSELGAGIGALRRSIKTSELTRVLNADTRIANAKVKLTGVVLSVRIDGTDEMPEAKSNEGAANVYADKDCVITYISVTEGRAMVKKGQAVRAGDILISGDLSDIKEGYWVYAEGVVYGETVYRASFTAEPFEERLVRSGTFQRTIAFSVFGQELFKGRPFPSQELELLRETRLTCSIIPIVVREYAAWELVPELTPDAPEGTEERARLSAQEKLDRILPKDAKIIAVSTKCKADPDGSVTATVTVTTVEKIGISRSF